MADRSPPTPLFPRAAGSFVGRTTELSRISQLASTDSLFLVYGVAGVGKSELVLRAIETLQESDPWRSIRPVLIAVEPHFRVGHLVAALRAGTEDATPGDIALRDPDADLAQLARALEARPRLLLLDDLHNLAPETASHLIGFLSRHVRASRVFATSRAEVPLDPGAPPPVITRLGPLGRDETGALVERLRHRLDLEQADAEAIFRASGGSPFHVQRALAATAGEDSLERTLDELPAAARELLLRASVVQTPLTARELGADPELLGELGRRFLVDVDRDVVLVHDIVRAAVARATPEGELSAARARAAELYRDRFLERPEQNQISIIQAIHCLVSAGEAAAAQKLVAQWYRAVAAAGLDHLLVDDLSALAEALPDARGELALSTARILVRRSRIREATDALAVAATDDRVAESPRYLLLAGEVAQRSGRMKAARDQFARARDAAGGEGERFQASLQLATADALAGDGGRARATLDAAMAELPWPSARHVARCGWVRAMSFALDEQLARAADAAREAAAATAGQGLDDLRLRLIALEAFARAEAGDVPRASALAGEVRAALGTKGWLREPIANLYLGFVAFEAGDQDEALAALHAAHHVFATHDDDVYASLSGYGIGRALSAAGRLAEAVDAVRAAASRSRASGLGSMWPRGLAELAGLLVARGRPGDAIAAAEETLGARRATPAARTLARAAACRAHVAAGDPDAARAALADARVARDEPAVDAAEAELELVFGDVDRAIRLAERACAIYARCGRRPAHANATALAALAYAGRGGLADRSLASRRIGEGRELAADRYPIALAWLSLASAALDRDAATAGMQAALAELPDDAGVARACLVETLQPGSADLTHGMRALLARLGQTSTTRFRLIDGAGERTITEAEVDALARERTLVADLTRGIIACGDSGQRVTGRTVGTKLLATLIEARGATVDAETLYCRVWDAPEYHALRNRNTLYTAISRLRRTLRELAGEREIVQTTSSGWRIADGVDACVVDVGDIRAM